jgi:hypothetical protein
VIYALSGQRFPAALQTDEPGLTTVGYKLKDGDVEIVPRTDVGIVESDPGLYEVQPIAPVLAAGVSEHDYSIVWDDGTSEPLYATETIRVQRSLNVARQIIMPTVADLGTFLKTRTKTRYGATVGLFNDTTPITTDEAETLIQEAADEVTIATGSEIPDGPNEDPDLYRRGVKALILLLAAMNAETVLSGEQVNDPRSPYTALERRYNALKKTVVEAVSEARGAYGGGESDAADSGASGMPSYSFPPASNLGTRRW